MRNLQDWYDEYGQSHQNPTNKKIHWVCVPAIFFSIIGMIMSIPKGPIEGFLGANASFLENWIWIPLVGIVLFYIRLSLKMSIVIMFFSLFCIVASSILASYVGSLFWFSLGLFVVAWIGQFVGHKIEGKKPSFLKDLQFLLIGPAWVFEQLLFGKK